ncbi:MAG: hypothetical protein HYY84_17110 [Deltaproteobacteria bacterium]|nr:hypothetical protein [Deltaproteobacteria bacterium]
MKTARKITIQVPAELLKSAQAYTGEGITPTVRRGLERLARAKAYEELLKMKGKVRLDIDLKKLRADRR